jgi:hypothetical protein
VLARSKESSKFWNEIDIYISRKVLVGLAYNLSHTFQFLNGLKQGDAFSLLLFNFALEFSIRKVQEIKQGLELNKTLQLLAYAGDGNLLCENINVVKKNTKSIRC